MAWRWMLTSALAIGLGLVLLAGSPGLAEEKAEKKEADEPKGKNLVVNGDFEEGEDSPKGWQQVDGLTTFWVRTRTRSAAR